MADETVNTAGLVTRTLHAVQNSIEATKWNVIELLTKHNTFGPDKIPKRPGDVAVLTGGTRGIGAEILKKLLLADMHVIIGCRNPQDGQAVISKIRKTVAAGKAECFPLDLMCLDSVRKFAQFALDKSVPIHVLINNAGIMWVPYNETTDKMESQFQVNYLSHFLLSMMLLPRLATSGTEGKNGRIVNVSSVAQYGGVMDFNNLQMKKNYTPARAYQTSKLMQVLSSNFLDAKLQESNVKVRVYSVHPGVIETDLYQTLVGYSVLKPVLNKLYKNSEQGADGVTFVALSPETEKLGGNIFGNSQIIRQAPQALDKTTQQKLYDVSLEMVQLNKEQLESSFNAGFKSA